jgi:hypothetical protein
MAAGAAPVPCGGGRDGRVVVNVNAGRYAVAPDGTLTAIGSTLVKNDPAAKPLDEGVSADQHYLYVMASGLSQVAGYRAGHDGSLTQVATAPAAAGSAGIGAN